MKEKLEQLQNHVLELALKSYNGQEILHLISAFENTGYSINRYLCGGADKCVEGLTCGDAPVNPIPCPESAYADLNKPPVASEPALETTTRTRRTKAQIAADNAAFQAAAAKAVDTSPGAGATEASLTTDPTPTTAAEPEPEVPATPPAAEPVTGGLTHEALRAKFAELKTKITSEKSVAAGTQFRTDFLAFIKTLGADNVAGLKADQLQTALDKAVALAA